MSVSRRGLLIAGLAALVAAGPAAAHRGHASLSVVEVESRTGRTTITHRFSAHDVEPALAAIAPEAQPSLDDPAALAAFEAYLLERFQLREAFGAVQLAHVETRLAGDDVTVTFRGQVNTPVRALSVRADFFGETWPEHAAQVNVRVGGTTRTLHFKPGDPAKSAAFEVVEPGRIF